MKKKGLFLLLVLWVLPFASCAIDFDFSCPSEVSINEEFNCSVSSLASGLYDLKIDFMQEGKRISTILDNGNWKSSNYYLIGFISDSEKQATLRLNGTLGESSGVIKLRQNGKTSIIFERNFTINLIEEEDIDNDKKEAVEPLEQDKDSYGDLSQVNESQEKESVIAEMQKPANESIINLNPFQEEKIVYESKNEKIKNYAIFGFCFFLIFIIIILILRR